MANSPQLELYGYCQLQLLYIGNFNPHQNIIRIIVAIIANAIYMSVYLALTSFIVDTAKELDCIVFHKTNKPMNIPIIDSIVDAMFCLYLPSHFLYFFVCHCFVI